MKSRSPLAPYVRRPVFAALLLAASVGSWVRSGRRADALVLYSWDAKVQAVAAERGRVWFFLTGIRVQPGRRMSWDHLAGSVDVFEVLTADLNADSEYAAGKFGFGVGYDRAAPRRSIPGPYCFLVVPHWPFVACGGLLLVTRLRRNRRYRRRLKKGLCLRCGYDLRESPTRCPECGTAAAVGGNSKDETRMTNN